MFRSGFGSLMGLAAENDGPRSAIYLTRNPDGSAYHSHRL